MRSLRVRSLVHDGAFTYTWGSVVEVNRTARDNSQQILHVLSSMAVGSHLQNKILLIVSLMFHPDHVQTRWVHINNTDSIVMAVLTPSTAVSVIR